MPTVNKVVKEFITFGDFVDENGPKLTKNAFEKLSLKERDEFRKAVSFNCNLNPYAYMTMLFHLVP